MSNPMPFVDYPPVRDYAEYLQSKTAQGRKNYRSTTMRVIEKQMIEAIKAMQHNSVAAHRTSWKSGNTVVSWSTTTGAAEEHAAVYLHGNLIALVYEGGLKITLAGWNTPTTRSRLTALCHAFGFHCYGVGTSKGQAAIRYAVKAKCRNISNTEWVTV